ncbi:MAG TPA: PBP1A family penicillin-binding protein [Candidatus Saccharimonadales bacterium]|nr:PBP1A family penicillin-binding protein [Candidatus Saccharimonadales bacterium]
MLKRLKDWWREFNFKAFLKTFPKRYKHQIIYAGIAVIILILLVPPITYLYFAKDLKDKDSIMNRGKTGLTLLTRDNKPFFTFYQPKEIQYVPLVEIPDNIQKAVIATEDKTFYTNPGFSIRGVARAFISNIFAGHIVEGGSTITQELAKNAFLSSNKNFLRKYQEIVLAAELNRRFSKQDILEMYLNSVYFGEGAFGVENASEAYFGKHASELSLSECALLVGILPAPSALSPLSNDESGALRKQKIVLSEMVKDGFLTHSEEQNAENKILKYNPSKIKDENTLAPHFAIYVKDQLIKKYGEERIIRDGFQVQTTLDEEKQVYAQKAVKNQMRYLKYNDASNGAAIAIDPKTGEILVMVGSYDFEDAKFGQTNMAISPRQPGSSFKPLIYEKAFEDKLITPATLLDDSAKTFDGNYKPLDYDKRFRGPVTVRRALANSLNIPAVEVMEKVGVPAGLEQAQNLGITTLGTDASRYGLSLVLGSGEVKLLELTDAYAVFADKGVYNPPKSVIEIKDKYGNIVDEGNFWAKLFGFLNTQTSKKVISEEGSYLISSILSDNKARAEEFGGALTISRIAAVKTGTTSDFRDALTVGYTPSLAVGVWVGNNDNTPMDNVAGSLGAAPIWRNMMDHFLLNTPLETFDKPTFVVMQPVCISGFKNYTEYFIAGTQPESCELPTPTFTPSPTISVTPTPTNKPDEPTPTPTPTNVPTSTPTQTLQITPSPTQSIPLPTVIVTP